MLTKTQEKEAKVGQVERSEAEQVDVVQGEGVVVDLVPGRMAGPFPVEGSEVAH